jgi:hypothetical protein
VTFEEKIVTFEANSRVNNFTKTKSDLAISKFKPIDHRKKRLIDTFLLFSKLNKRKKKKKRWLFVYFTKNKYLKK